MRRRWGARAWGTRRGYAESLLNAAKARCARGPIPVAPSRAHPLESGKGLRWVTHRLRERNSDFALRLALRT